MFLLGSGHFIVSAIGMKTEFGQIAGFGHRILLQKESPSEGIGPFDQTDLILQGVCRSSYGRSDFISPSAFISVSPLIFALGMIVAFIP